MTMGTASTMTSAAEALGLTLPGAASIPGRRFAARADGRRHRPAHRRDGVGGPEAARHSDRARASTTRSPRCWRSAGRPTPSCISSRWRAAPASRSTLDRFDALARTHAAARQHAARRQVPDGGFLLRRAACARCWRASATCSTLDATTVNGTTLGENIAGADVFNDDVIRPRERSARRVRAASPCCAAISRPTAP